MKNHIQNQFPYDSCILGLNGTYIDYGVSFLINAEFILATDEIVAVGKEYVLFNYSAKAGNKISDIILFDCFYSEGNINLIVHDVRSQEEYTITQCLECPESDCPWILVDLNYFFDLLDKKAIRDYCRCDNNTKRTKGESNPEVNEDLLEFEF